MSNLSALLNESDKNAGMSVEILGHTYFAGGSVKWCIHHGKQLTSSEKSKFPHKLPVVHLDIYPRGMKTWLHKP
jgi:hypothetical protein